MSNFILALLLFVSSFLYFYTPPRNHLSLPTQSPEATFLLATEAFREGDFKTAKTHFKRLFSSEEHTKDLIRNAFCYLVVIGDVDKAYALTSKYFDDESSTSLMLVLKGVNGLKTGSYDFLCDYSLDGASITASTVIIQYLKILSYLGRKNYDAAENLLENENGSLKDLFLVYSAYVQKQEASYKSHLDKVLLQCDSFSDLTLHILRGFVSPIDCRAIDATLTKRNPGLPLGESPPQRPWTLSTLSDIVLLEMVFGFITSPDGISTFIARMLEWISPQSPSTKLALAVALKESHCTEESLRILESLKGDQEIGPYTLLTQTELYLDQGQVDKTLAIYKHLRETYITWTLPYLEAAKIYLNEKRISDAQEILQKGLTLTPSTSPDRWRFHFMLGSAYETQKEPEKTIQELKVAQTLDPHNPYILNFLAYTWTQNGGNLHQAIKLLIKATTIAPDVGAFWDSLGWAYFKNNQIQLAREHIEKALSLSPEDSIAYNHLGDVYWHIGLYTQAHYQWQKALAYNEEGSDLNTDEVKTKLKGINRTPPHAYSKGASKEQKKP